jgi:hypothetical protein
MTHRAPPAAILLCAVLLSGSGCAQAATARGMTLGAGELKGPPSAAVASAFAVGEVSGGQETTSSSHTRIADAPFREALRESLRIAGLLSERPDAPLSVGATLVEQNVQTFGFSLTAGSVVRYMIRETRSGAAVIDETISTTHTATVSDAFNAETRIRLAVEGAARNSLAALVQRLNTIQRKGAAAPPPAPVPSS